MSDTLHYFPAGDIADSVAAALKSVLIDLPAFKKACPGFTTQLSAGDQLLVFPEVGVDFRNLTVSGATGAYYPEVLMPEGVVARLRFVTPQGANTAVVVPDYSAFTTYFIGQLDDIPFDLYTYLGDPLGEVKQERKIPIGIPVVENFRITRYAGRGETATIFGHFCVYGGAAQGNKAVVKVECKKLYDALQEQSVAFAATGITQLVVKPPIYKTYAEDSVIVEGALQFSCVVRLS